MKSCSNDSRDMFKTYIKDLNDVTYHLQEYEKFTSNNSKTFSSAVHLRHLVLEFNAIEKFSESYCIHKLSEIQNASSVVAKAFGRNKTQDICIYDVGVIYTQFKNSYLSGRISQLEFTNLLSGLSHLEQLDNNWCNNSRRYNIEYLIKSNPP